jgi:hypothetical protein
MNRSFFLLLVLFSLLPMTGRTQAASISVDPMKFFTGHTRSFGVFENRSGQPIRSVKTETWGRVVHGELRIEQNLYIGDQPRQRRLWKVRRLDAQHFEATANDIVGKARGRMTDKTFSWSFTLATKPGHPLFNVRMTQHMYFQPDGRTMVNRSMIRKCGFLIGSVTEQFRRE